MVEFALSAIGRDRPGIVAEVAAVLLGYTVNIRDSHMSQIGGRFAMMLLVAAPDSADVGALSRDLKRAGERLGLDAISLAPVSEAGEASASAPSHIVSVYGVDHPGIVQAVSARLAARGVNVTNLETRLVDDAVGPGLYALVLEVALPQHVGADALRTLLDGIGVEQGVEVAIRSLESDVM